MKNPRRFFLGLGMLAVGVLVCIPFAVDRPTPLFGQTVSVLPVGLFPALAALGILVFSALEWFRGGAASGEVLSGAEEGTDGPRSLVPLVLILLAAAFLDTLGYVLTTALTAAILSTAMGNRNPLLLVVASLAAPLSIYWLVTRVFSTYLPTGIVLSDVFS